jgi:hypothetical protein
MGQTAVARKIAQIFHCAEIEVRLLQDLKQLQPALSQVSPPTLVCLSSSDLVDALALSQGSKGVSFLPCVEDVEPPVFVSALDARVIGVLATPGAGQPPRAWELLSIANRYTQGRLPSPSTPLSWGHFWYERRLHGSNDRRAMVEAVERFCSELQTSRQAHSAAQLADELIMNAIYDAPLDQYGRQKYAHRRRDAIELEQAEYPIFGFGSDGARIVISVTDPFGHLSREAVFGGIHRGLTTGAMDSSGGGAGLGMLLIHNTAKVLFIDVVPNRTTQVTGVIELDVPPTQLRRQPGSVHYFTY